MPVKSPGFSLMEVLIAMAIGSMLLLATSRFLPALQGAVLRQTRQQALEEEVWQRVYVVAKHLQRAGYCNGSCSGEPLQLEKSGECLIVRWDANSNGIWDTAPVTNADSTGFRLNNYALETLRGATTCAGKGWEKMTDPGVFHINNFTVTRIAHAGFAPQLTVTMMASLTSDPQATVSAQYSVMGFNL
ncbi:prepilin peptidase-dependent protein B [Trabulsiella guamensis ATCC 49490]|uniref:Prepilin peptidase-dependent protein B n=1 Tax=Trabulsiella guamensis ATCC 49490 TaxID=1005994 RepID=A0A085A7H1_9ENTR|nr:prepilin peptidase-dependent protein [Trabulsiella guamensis]KFC06166.1 prepilin peptidase-dependent protein B [Trabulsiella guamensis ATCC 49490]